MSRPRLLLVPFVTALEWEKILPTLGEWADVGEKIWRLDVYRCSSCKRVEFFDLDLSLPQS